MTNIEKLLSLVPMGPIKIRLSSLQDKTGMTGKEILKLAKELEFDVNTRMNNPTISQKRVERNTEILIYKDQVPYKAVKGITEAAKLTKVPKSTIINMISRKLTKKTDKENGGRTSPNGWGFDSLFS